MTTNAEETRGHVVRLRYLQTTDRWHTWYPLVGLDRAMAAAGLGAIRDRQNQTLRRFARVLSSLHLVRNLRRSSGGPIFVAMMGYSEGRTFPFSYWSELVPYAFDCWPNVYDRWTGFFHRHRVRLAFFSARASAEHFAREIPAMTSVWLPEAVDPVEYSPSLRLVDRRIDVLELARRYDRFHDAVTGPLAAHGRVHRFEQAPGQRLFPTRQGLTEGLASTRISVCFPRSLTHPDTTGGVETVTHRYFESMASGCILLGHCPQELLDLFGYNPVVEVETGNEAGQVDWILSNLPSYQDLVRVNLERLAEVGTWAHRVPDILRHFKEAGRTWGVP